MKPPTIPYHKDNLIRLVKELALEIKPEGEFFVLKSGAKSKFYLDCRKLTLHDVGLHTIVNGMWDMLCDLKLPVQVEIDAIGGPCVGADPIVGGLLYRAGFHNSHGDTRGFLVRKEEKDHGKAGRIIGSIKPGDNCLFIEDVTTTGGTSIEAIEAIEAYGAKVCVIFAVVDRLAGASEAFEAKGIPFYPLLTTQDLGI